MVLGTDNYFVHGIGLVFYFFLMWLSLKLAFAAWGSRRANAQWHSLVRTRFMQAIRIKWLSLILVVLVAMQIALVIGMLGISAYTGNPITFD